MEQKRYITDVWAKLYPDRREKVYGFLEYDKNLCSFVSEHIPKGSKLLEVAVGTGFPFADFFQKAGYVVHGMDISPYLIEKCRELNPNIICKVGDAENLEYEDNCYDVTYCLHSTWYFPNLLKAIDEMIRVTRPKGMIIFDIQNRNNRKIAEGYNYNVSQGKGMRRIIRFFKNIVLIILGKNKFSWHFLFKHVVYETPTFPEDIYQHLGENKVDSLKVMVMEKDKSIHESNELGPFENYMRLVFVIRK
jgi:ubiquinone/menaquinone biosynthesis C-methylase UbiE